MAYDYNLCVKAAKSRDIKMWLIVAQYLQRVRGSWEGGEGDNPGLGNYIEIGFSFYLNDKQFLYWKCVLHNAIFSWLAFFINGKEDVHNVFSLVFHKW